MDLRMTLKGWLKGFAACVRQQNFNRGKTYFYKQVYCFGSYATACDGLEDLVADQWKKIWPNIDGFSFDLKRLHAEESSDGRWLCAMLPWRSTGYLNGRSFRRNGRVTIVLKRPGRGKPWRAVHTHYSLNPGTPQTTIKPSSRKR